MTVYLTNGNPIIAMVITTLSTFKTSALIGAFRSILLSFDSEEAAKKFFEDFRNQGGHYSIVELNNVVFKPDFGGSLHAVRAVYHALTSYKESLISINNIDINSPSEASENILKEIEQYINEHFGSDAITVK